MKAITIEFNDGKELKLLETTEDYLYVDSEGITGLEKMYAIMAELKYSKRYIFEKFMRYIMDNGDRINKVTFN